ncbi:aminotransferase class I/II-fold pyridoxal phosphate-dependent enzyme [Lactobacillus sp. S2-2]|uniref:aminotransferase-like domain-containing protein n=1 Tax=Lactobacillus sp. S2-2 TaxID=2692917 RepID=UPI001F47C806|nr:PLP-dependent aminotransferase family protein [Lactobacillus sp. S2-2]MCF6514678.1 aminotransferase class I/II-fold pyridoxal phosphate-dependent enzyme [Lactobacillus sp. S2-2]
MTNYEFSNSVPKKVNDAIGEVFKAASDPEVISFAGGLPAPELFPVQEIKQATSDVFDQYGKEVLQYSGAIGYKGLREQIVDIMAERKVETNIDNIAITTGSQQSIDLTARMLINPNDVIFVEDPTYLSAIDVFKSYGAKIIGIPMDDDGIRIDVLREKMEKYPNGKMIYTIPNFQNPTGRTLSLERRKELVSLANEFGTHILEDDPYGAIRFSGEFLPSLKSFDTEERVIYLSSFSKILAPGLRMGWLVADSKFMDKFLLMKQSADLHTDNLTQYIISQFMKNNDIKQHIKLISEAYKNRADLMIKQIDKKFPEGVKHSNPEGGMFIWVELPGNIDSDELFKICIKNNVAFVSGSAFYPNKVTKGTFRMNFSNMSDEQIILGIDRMAKAIKEMM